jgi:uridylate kinase
VYDKDPAKYKDAIKLDKVTFANALSNNAISVMDKAAIGLAMEQKKTLVVFDVMKPDNLLKIASGQHVGTTIQ